MVFNIGETVGIEESVKEVIDLLEWGSEKNAHSPNALFSWISIQGCKYSMIEVLENRELKDPIPLIRKYKNGELELGVML